MIKIRTQLMFEYLDKGDAVITLSLHLTGDGDKMAAAPTGDEGKKTVGRTGEDVSAYVIWAPASIAGR